MLNSGCFPYCTSPDPHLRTNDRSNTPQRVKKHLKRSKTPQCYTDICCLCRDVCFYTLIASDEHLREFSFSSRNAPKLDVPQHNLTEFNNAQNLHVICTGINMFNDLCDSEAEELYQEVERDVSSPRHFIGVYLNQQRNRQFSEVTASSEI